MRNFEAMMDKWEPEGNGAVIKDALRLLEDGLECRGCPAHALCEGDEHGFRRCPGALLYWLAQPAEGEDGQ